MWIREAIAEWICRPLWQYYDKIPHHINYKIMCLSAYWQWNYCANKRARVSAVIVGQGSKMCSLRTQTYFRLSQPTAEMHLRSQATKCGKRKSSTCVQTRSWSEWTQINKSVCTSESKEFAAVNQLRSQSPFPGLPPNQGKGSGNEVGGKLAFCRFCAHYGRANGWVHITLSSTSLLVSSLTSSKIINHKNSSFLNCDLCLKKSYFLLFHLPSCFWTVCYQQFNKQIKVVV